MKKKKEGGGKEEERIRKKKKNKKKEKENKKNKKKNADHSSDKLAPWLASDSDCVCARVLVHVYHPPQDGLTALIFAAQQGYLQVVTCWLNLVWSSTSRAM